METKKVLIVEDEMIIAMLIERMVTNMGHEVIEKISSGEEAIDKALELSPDIILMDIRLRGEIDGIEAMSKIQEKMAIPVIYISGNSDLAHREKIEMTEYIDFLSKPITESDLSKSFNIAS
ncbi:response regulator [Aliifodinibius salipaludis]|uniref:Response regulator n=1 Tax=Fodinibius salipaludis TaxID=2032627 RepID=A0A2A2G8W7_9BACT|nr:response regulator [Aliifodinibius salipaludis]PAU93309.1 response regulator [Aliifodinibius salipaludis]